MKCFIYRKSICTVQIKKGRHFAGKQTKG